MKSQIDATKPTHWNPKTADIRSNFQIAVDEINALASSLGIVSSNVDIDGGGAVTIYEIKASYVDGGTSISVHGLTDQTFDGNLGSDFVIDGGDA